MNFGLHMVCVETICFLIEPLYGIKSTYRSIVYRMIRILKAINVFELHRFEFKSHLNSEMQ